VRLINNTNKPNDRMFKVLNDYGKNTTVYIASAFFNDYKTLLKMVDEDCEIFMVIRLDMGTSPDSLEHIINHNKIHIRFFTGTSFHPKFYIFQNQAAILGSSNLTKSGLQGNQEANIEIEYENPIVEDLKEIFNDYWNNAEPLDPVTLKNFKEIMKGFSNPEPYRVIEKKIGSHHYDNVGSDDKANKESLYVSTFKRAYQLYLSKFDTLITLYKSFDLRRYPEIPLRIEVDRFLWWIREVKAKGDSYKRVPVASDDVIKGKLTELIPEFMSYDSDYLDNIVVPQYLDFVKTFATQENISNLDIDIFYENLLNVHAFHDCFRFHNGGHSTMKEYFLTSNTHEKIKSTISYILFNDKEPYQTRIMNSIFNDNYKLKGFGESCVKEIFGLLNEENIPVSNGRTIKSMEWLGFGKL